MSTAGGYCCHSREKEKQGQAGMVPQNLGGLEALGTGPVGTGLRERAAVARTQGGCEEKGQSQPLTWCLLQAGPNWSPRARSLAMGLQSSDSQAQTTAEEGGG